MDPLQRTHTFSEKVRNGAEKMAQRMGGQFVENQRWENVVAASSNENKIETKKPNR